MPQRYPLNPSDEEERQRQIAEEARRTLANAANPERTATITPDTSGSTDMWQPPVAPVAQQRPVASLTEPAEPTGIDRRFQASAVPAIGTESVAPRGETFVRRPIPESIGGFQDRYGMFSGTPSTPAGFGAEGTQKPFVMQMIRGGQVSFARPDLGGQEFGTLGEAQKGQTVAQSDVLAQRAHEIEKERMKAQGALDTARLAAEAKEGTYHYTPNPRAGLPGSEGEPSVIVHRGGREVVSPETEASRSAARIGKATDVESMAREIEGMNEAQIKAAYARISDKAQRDRFRSIVEKLYGKQK